MTDKMREDYEAWFKSFADIDVIFDENGQAFAISSPVTHGDKIVNTVVDGAWKAWQASRAALCVKLPRQTYDEDLDCDTMIAHHVGKALDAAGIRYK